MSRRAFLLVLLLTLMAVTCVRAAVMSPALLRAMAGGNEVDVFVLLRDAPQVARPTEERPALRLARSRGAVVLLPFQTLPAVALRLRPAAAAQLADDPDVVAMDVLGHSHAALVNSVPLIGATTLHDAGITGAGSVVAVIDTGVDANHPDIAGRVDAEECFCVSGCCPDGSTRQSGAGSARTVAVHGAHVAGIIAASGAKAGPGVAPEAHLVALRVLDDDGMGCPVDWMAALDWLLASGSRLAAVNMSLVDDEEYAGPCDQATATTMAAADLVGRLRARGTLVVAASGNNGQRALLPSPACLSEIVAVAATTKEDGIAPFSNTTPGVDLLAPGQRIISDAPNGMVAQLSGTSMATAHVSGAVALLQPLVGWRAAPGLKALLQATGVSIAPLPACTDPTCIPLPRIDVAAAADWIARAAAFVPGGGNRSRDCLVEWDVRGFAPEPATRQAARCHDGDPICDADDVDGQCTFTVAAGFNVPDRRLPCDPSAGVASTQLLRPLPDADDQIDRDNAAAIAAVLPAGPVATSTSTGTFPFIVPRGVHGGTGTMRLVAHAAAGADLDRVRFICLPPAGQ